MKLTGTVKFFNVEKLYGFIKATDGREFFFHKSGLVNSETYPQKGASVRFETQNSDRGPKAVEVELI